MSSEIAVAATLEELQRLVHRTLCEHDHLEPEESPLRQAIVTRSGKPCGLFFQVEGPRLLKTYAIWSGEEDRLLFYDSAGTRFAEVRLSEGPDVMNLAA